MKCIIKYLTKIFIISLKKKNNNDKKTWKDLETSEKPLIIDLYRKYPDLKD